MKRRFCFACLCLFLLVVGVGVVGAGKNADSGPAKKEKSVAAAPVVEKAKKEPAKEEKGKQTEAKKSAAAKKTAGAAEVSKKGDASKKEGEKEKCQAKAGEEAQSPPATETVKKTPLKITVELEGVFEGEGAREIAVPAKEWTALEVRRAVPHGAVVRKGDVVLELETEKLDRAIAELQLEQKIADLAFAEGERQLRFAEKTAAMELEAGNRAAAQAEEDQKFFFDTVCPLLLRLTDFELKMAKEALEYEQEELRQLEKMYKADDITEETEEIVLRRARDTVERAKFSVEIAQIFHDRTVQVSLPRMEEDVKESVRRSALAWERTKKEIPAAIKKQRLEMEKARLQRAPAEEKMKRLLADRKLVTVRSPIDGTVYYGKFSRGRSADSSSLVESLRPRGSIPAEQTVMTIVARRPTCIRAMISESQLRDLRPGVKGLAVPTARPDVDFQATIDRVDDIPMSPGNFDARISVRLPAKVKWLVPGMTCKVALVAYLKKDALCVPPKTLIPDELDSRKQYVMVLKKDGKTEKRPVTVGRQTDKQVEILKGLGEGDKVVAEPNK